MQFSKEMMKGTAEIIVLRALAKEGETYGYQLIKTISSTSKKIFEFSEGTLYPILYRLEKRGDISSRIQVEQGKSRRYYRLTPKGKKSLAEKKSELGLFTQGLQKLFHFGQ